MADIAKALNDKIFFSGAHVGASLGQCQTYYEKIADAGSCGHSGAPDGEKLIDFRTNSDPPRRVYVYYRKADRKIVSVLYWKMGQGETFSTAEMNDLINLNLQRGLGTILCLFQTGHNRGTVV